MGEENNIHRDTTKWNLGEVLGLLLYVQRYVSEDELVLDLKENPSGQLALTVE